MGHEGQPDGQGASVHLLDCVALHLHPALEGVSQVAGAGLQAVVEAGALGGVVGDFLGEVDNHLEEGGKGGWR